MTLIFFKLYTVYMDTFIKKGKLCDISKFAKN